MRLDDTVPWATIMLGALVAVAAVAGGVIVIAHPETLNFEQYLNLLRDFAIALGILGVGRGITSAGRSNKEAQVLNSQALVESGPPAGDWRANLGAGDAD